MRSNTQVNLWGCLTIGKIMRSSKLPTLFILSFFHSFSGIYTAPKAVIYLNQKTIKRHKKSLNYRGAWGEGTYTYTEPRTCTWVNTPIAYSIKQTNCRMNFILARNP